MVLLTIVCSTCSICVLGVNKCVKERLAFPSSQEEVVSVTCKAGDGPQASCWRLV